MKNNLFGEPVFFDDYFEEFWKLYPRKVGKKYAAKIYLREVKSEDLHKRIMKSLEFQIRRNKWDKPEKYDMIPHPSTWLGQQRWNDVIPETYDNIDDAIKRAIELRGKQNGISK